jgi:hypothetical protein
MGSFYFQRRRTAIALLSLYKPPSVIGMPDFGNLRWRVRCAVGLVGQADDRGKQGGLKTG